MLGANRNYSVRHESLHSQKIGQKDQKSPHICVQKDCQESDAVETDELTPKHLVFDEIAHCQDSEVLPSLQKSQEHDARDQQESRCNKRA